MANRRDLHVSVNADDRGFGAAFEDAKDKARGLDRELVKLERQQAANEKVTTRTAAAIDLFAKSEDKAGLAARKMGLEVKRAAEQAEKAEVRAAAAAEAAAKGLIDEEKAARLAARADEAVERAAIKAAEAQLAQAAAAKKLADEQRRAAESAGDNRAAAEGMRGGLLAAGAAAAGLSVPVAAAGLAFVGMAAVAAPAINKVIAAQTDLGANWDTLDRGQKIAASSVQALIGDYKALAQSYQPDALATFNGLISTARGLLPQLGNTIDSTKAAVADFADTIEGSLNRQIPRLAGILQGQATPALHELGTAAGQTANLAVNLVQGLAPMGVTLLHDANGVLTLLNALTAIDPRLTEFAAVAVALRGPTTALSGLWTSGAAKVSAWGKSTAQAESKVGGLAKGAAKAEGTIGKLGKAVGSSPNLYIGAALAVGYLVTRLATMKDGTDNLIQSLRVENNAFGNNVAGHRAVADSLSKQIVQQKAAEAAALEGGVAENTAQSVTTQYGNAIKKLTNARKDELAAVRNITAGENSLASQYHISAEQAGQLATAAGVDLSKSMTKSGQLTNEAAAKIKQYQAAVAAASNPTQRIAEDMNQAANTSLLMADRLKAVDDAIAAYFGPASEAWNATTALKQGMRDLADAMKKAHGDFSGNTAASQRLRTALDQQLNIVNQLYHANLQTKGYQTAHAAAESQIQVMYALAGRSKGARSEIDALAHSLGVSVGKSNLSKGAFIAAAEAMGKSRAQANALWHAYNRLPAAKHTTVTSNAAEQAKAVQDYQYWLSRLHNKTVYVHTIYTASGSRTFGPGNKKLGEAHGGLIGYAHGGAVGMADGGPSGPVVGPGSGTSDDIPVFLSNGEYVIRASQTRKHRGLLDAINQGRDGFARGGLVARYASGGTVGGDPLSLADVLQHWQDAAQPATKADVDKAIKARRNEVNKLKDAEDALARARKRHDPRAIAAAERRIASARQDLAAATSKLKDVETRFRFAKLSPIAQLDAALGLGIKDNAAFIKNLQTLADRGFGDLAQKLLALGGPQAEKIAASAVKLSNSKLSAISKKIGQEQQQEDVLANLPAILSVRSAINNTKGGISSWVALLNATGLDAGALSEAVKLIAGDLSKTASGKALIADMHAHGFARGGLVSGPAGVDQVPARLTAGEYVVTRQAAAAYRPLLDVLNTGARVPVSSHDVRSGASGWSSPAQVTQNNVFQAKEPHVVARESARELAWLLRG